MALEEKESSQWEWHWRDTFILTGNRIIRSFGRKSERKNLSETENTTSAERCLADAGVPSVSLGWGDLHLFIDRIQVQAGTKPTLKPVAFSWLISRMN